MLALQACGVGPLYRDLSRQCPRCPSTRGRFPLDPRPGATEVRMQGSIDGPGDTEPEVGKPEPSPALAAERRATVARYIVPRAAAQHTTGTVAIVPRAAVHRGALVVLVPAVIHPLPGVGQQVVHSERVRPIRSHRCRLRPPVPATERIPIIPVLGVSYGSISVRILCCRSLSPHYRAVSVRARNHRSKRFLSPCESSILTATRMNHHWSPEYPMDNGGGPRRHVHHGFAGIGSDARASPHTLWRRSSGVRLGRQRIRRDSDGDRADCKDSGNAPAGHATSSMDPHSGMTPLTANRPFAHMPAPTSTCPT